MKDKNGNEIVVKVLPPGKAIGYGDNSSRSGGLRGNENEFGKAAMHYREQGMKENAKRGLSDYQNFTHNPYGEDK